MTLTLPAGTDADYPDIASRIGPRTAAEEQLLARLLSGNGAVIDDLTPWTALQPRLALLGWVAARTQADPSARHRLFRLPEQLLTPARRFTAVFLHRLEPDALTGFLTAMPEQFPRLDPHGLPPWPLLELTALAAVAYASHPDGAAETAGRRLGLMLSDAAGVVDLPALLSLVTIPSAGYRFDPLLDLVHAWAHVTDTPTDHEQRAVLQALASTQAHSTPTGQTLTGTDVRRLARVAACA